jgi:hypothetical protein
MDNGAELEAQLTAGWKEKIPLVTFRAAVLCAETRKDRAVGERRLTIASTKLSLTAGAT